MYSLLYVPTTTKKLSTLSANPAASVSSAALALNAGPTDMPSIATDIIIAIIPVFFIMIPPLGAEQVFYTSQRLLLADIEACSAVYHFGRDIAFL